MEQNTETHDLIYKYLSKKKLNELFLRTEHKVLENEINDRLKKVTPIVAKTTISTKKGYICSIYINFLNTNEKQIGHLSFHFSKNNSNSTIGRSHPKNNINTQRRYTLRFNTKQNIFHISLSKYGSIINPDLQKCFNTGIDVFNEYFNPNSSLFLGIRLFPNEKHSCYDYIIHQMKSTKTPILNTRKRSYKTIS